MKQTGLMLAFLVLLSGCAREVHKDFVATGGSKADGVVELSYFYDPELEIPVSDPAQGKEVAVQRCKLWGYKDAELFHGVKETCSITGLYGVCRKSYSYIQYQCLDEDAEKILLYSKDKK